ncbi:MAG: hypothetical protein CM15mP112_00030 [Flavobacteriales bacterium]|nr:MAG: hypothetical protein CM15mP112_00030 [Flavobacteriales bacterium]
MECLIIFLNVGDVIVTQVTWANQTGNIQFKGSFGTIVSISTNIEAYAGLHFADAEVRFMSNDREKLYK